MESVKTSRQFRKSPLVGRGQELALRDGIALESLAFAQYVFTSSHPAEGIQAFKEKRQPEF